ncbi:MAG: ABC transporter substrate-binding protein [Lachnospiraceae bacterium]|uniref:ABC transporter substrate-binding protein n=1 Tax=Candidatus Weimeria bifida TaxID=2599074 RepID=A0A6N7IX87_9FIRM|nr:ABC transporter substrate-binding protein [Candidatus Weimeria bifida]RRF97194.1 MAG: ABC transporter substrate-binding protein [Lachnospiraceae bacterium]
MRKRLAAIMAAAALLLSGCAAAQGSSGTRKASETASSGTRKASETASSGTKTSGKKKFVYSNSHSEHSSESQLDEKKFMKDFNAQGFKLVKTEKNTAAKQFEISEYKKDGKTVYLLVIDGNNNYLICPKDFSSDSVKNALGDRLTVITQGIDNIYLAASAAAANFRAINAIDSIGFSGIAENEWYIPEIKSAMKKGTIKYAGKFSAPDYELLTSKKVPLAIESTMITHAPAVKEKLAKLGIPILVDYSSYETTSEARMEWVRVYGLITGHEKEASGFFDKEMATIKKVANLKSTGKTCAYFSIDTSGSITVKRGSDYMARMIKTAGGSYVFSYIEAPSKKSHMANVSVTFEDFYKKAKDADVLMIDTATDNSIKSLNDLESRNKLFKDFKAVKSGNIYTTADGLFQFVDKSAEITTDMHRIFTDGNPKQYFTKLK